MYKYKIQKKHKNYTKNTDLIRRLKESEMEINRLRLKISWFEDKIIYDNELMSEKISYLEDKIDDNPF